MSAILRCIVCGGDHEPSPSVCTDAGMDKMIEKLGSQRWNALTGFIQRRLNARRREADGQQVTK